MQRQDCIYLQTQLLFLKQNKQASEGESVPFTCPCYYAHLKQETRMQCLFSAQQIQPKPVTARLQGEYALTHGVCAIIKTK